MNKYFILAGLFAIGFASAQQGEVGINTGTPAATLDIRPSAANSQETATSNEGILIPRLSKARLANIADANLVKGTLVFVDGTTYTGTNSKVDYVVTEGFHFYDGTTWQPFQKAASLRADYVLSLDGTVLVQWLNKFSGTTIDMNSYADMAEVTTIGGSLFEVSGTVQQPSVQNFIVKEGVTTIGSRAFYGVTNMNITLPNSLQHIGDNAFYNNKTFTSLSLPNVLTIGNSAFVGNTSLTSISLPAATTIGSSAFSGNTSLTSISLPAATTIGSNAFSGNTKLTSISLPAATTIGINAFSGNTSLTSISLPAATTIGRSAFYGNTALESVIIGPNITSIGDELFNNNSQPITLTVQATTPPRLLGEFYSDNDIIIKVPMASVDAYKTADTWSMYADKIVGY